MSVKYYYSGNLEYRQNEQEQIFRILQKIHDAFNESKEEVYVILDVIIGNYQYDMIFIKNNAIVCVEFKNYEGDIIGAENSDWYVIAENGDKISINDGRNIFRQVRSQRYQLIEFVNKVLSSGTERFKDNAVSHISAIVCFKGGNYNYDQIDKNRHLWFAVENENTIIDFLKRVNSNEFLLRKAEILLLINQLGLNEFDINNLIEVGEQTPETIIGFETQDDDSTYSEVFNLDLDDATPQELEAVISFLFPDDKCITNLQEISNKVKDTEKAIQLLSKLKELGLISQPDSQTIKLIEDWRDILSNQEDLEMSISAQQLFYKTSFLLSPGSTEEGTEYLGVYRGTKYHFNSSGVFWWEISGSNEKLEFEFTEDSIKQKLLNIKPLGGSFRITESGEVLTKKDDNGEFIPIFVTKFNGTIVFKNRKIKWNPSGLKPGDLWSSIYDGTTLSVNSNRQLFIRVNNKKCYAEEGHEDIVDKVLQFKPNGGRVKITETGKILTLMYSVPYPAKIKKQFGRLNDFEKNLISIRHQLHPDKEGMVPVYLGKFTGNIKFRPPLDLEREWSEEDDEEFLSRIGVL